MKRFVCFLASLILVFNLSACSSEETLSFSLFSTSDLRLEHATGEKLEKIESWYSHAEEFMGMKIVIDQEMLLNDKIERRCSEYVRQNDLADVFVVVDSGGDTMKSLIEQGKIVNLLDYKEHMPNYSKILEQNYNYELTNVNGGIYSFASAIYSSDHVSQYGWLYNYTVFKENNIAVPKNLDELYAAAKALKKLYPDSYPIMFNSTDINYICDIFGLPNRSKLMNYFNGEKYVIGAFEDPQLWKNVLEYMNRLYREGLIAPQFNVYSNTQVEYNAKNRKTFIVPSTWGGEASDYSRDSGDEWILSSPPNGFGNTSPYYGTCEERGYILSKSWNLCVSSEAENIELLVKLIDNEYSEKMMDLTNWGQKDIHYTVDSGGEKHLIAKTADEYNKLNSEIPLPAALKWVQDRDSESAKNFLLDPVGTVFNGSYKKDSYWQAVKSENVSPDDSAKANAAYTTLTREQNSFIKENLVFTKSYLLTGAKEFITGKRSFSQWEQFISEAKSQSNWQSALDEYNRKLETLG